MTGDRSEYFALLRQAAKSLGLCGHCRKAKRAPGRATCAKCLERNRVRTAAQRKQRKKKG